MKRVLREDGFWVLLKKSGLKLRSILSKSPDPLMQQNIQYKDWIENIESRYLDKGYMEKLNNHLKLKPKFSIIFPVWNKPQDIVEKALKSIINQSYQDFEICISDGSTENVDIVKKFLLDFQNRYEDVVKLSFLDDAGPINIIENSNNAISLAKGDFCVFMDCDDEISENCLLELAWQINKTPDIDLIYSDFDKNDLSGKRFDPSFWPDWSPHTILAQMYTTHVTCYRRSILEQLGGLRSGTAGAQDWDLVLRLSEISSKIAHIPKILYHWRVYSDSTASSINVKSWAFANQMKVLEDWVKRNNIDADVDQGAFAGAWRVRFNILNSPKISIIIPFRDKVELLKRCVESIINKTSYDNYELILINNQSEEEKTFKYLESLESLGNRVKVIEFDQDYHFGRICNTAVEHVSGDHLLFLNNDTEVIDSEWLEAMIEYSQQENIGAVGAKLIFPDGKIQHAGVIVGIRDAAAHAHRGINGWQFGYNGWLVNIRNVMAVTGACMMIKKDLFVKIGGFDENFDPPYQDVDLCIRLYDAGYWNVFTPYAQLIHHEAATRADKKYEGRFRTDIEVANLLREAHPKYLEKGYEKDPFYNVNLSYDYEDFRLREDWEPSDWGKRIDLII